MVKEARKVPVLNDTLDHEVIGPAIKKEIQMGGLKILVARLKSGSVLFRTGRVERLVKLSAKELEELSLRWLDAKSIESLLN